MNYRTISFLSHFINNSTPCYGGNSAIHIHSESSIKCDITCNSQKWSFDNHIGTHIDLPKHFDSQGRSLESYAPPEWIFSSPYLLELPTKEAETIVPVEAFEQIPLETDFLIIRTGFEKYRNEKIYWEKNPGFDSSVAIWLREKRKNIKAIGFDTISLTGYQNRQLGRIAHQIFLQEQPPICIIEDMKIAHLQKSPSKLIVAPIMIEGADGGPVTIFSFE